MSGNAKVSWSGPWTLDGVVTARGINAAVFAPALLSEGKAEGSGRFSMSGAEPAKLASAGPMEGSFTVNKGALGSIDIVRALTSGGRQAVGRTPFPELNGLAVTDKGAAALRNTTIRA